MVALRWCIDDIMPMMVPEKFMTLSVRFAPIAVKRTAGVAHLTAAFFAA